MVEDTTTMQVNLKMPASVKDRLAATAFRRKESLTAFLVGLGLAAERGDWEQWMRDAAIVAPNGAVPLLLGGRRRTDGAQEFEFQMPPTMAPQHAHSRLGALGAAAGFGHIHRVPSAGDDTLLHLVCSDTDLLEMDQPFEEHASQMLRGVGEHPDMRWALGVSAGGGLVCHDWLDAQARPNLLVAGISGAGKTTLLKSMLHQLCANNAPQHLQLYLIGSEFEAGTWPEHEASVTPGAERFNAAGPVADALDAAHDEMHNRLRAAAADGRRNAEDDRPVLLVVVDDCHTYMWDQGVTIPTQAQAMLRARNTIHRLVRQGSTAAVRVAASTQHAGREHNMGTFKATSDCIGFAVRSKRASEAIIDAAGLEHITGKGRGKLATAAGGIIDFKAHQPPAGHAATIHTWLKTQFLAAVATEAALAGHPTLFVNPKPAPNVSGDSSDADAAAAAQESENAQTPDEGVWIGTQRTLSRAPQGVVDALAPDEVLRAAPGAALIGKDPLYRDCYLSDQDRLRGVAVHGDPATGKTALLLALLANDCAQRFQGRHHPMIWLASSSDSAHRAAQTIHDHGLLPMTARVFEARDTRLDLVAPSDSAEAPQTLAAALQYACGLSERASGLVTTALQAALPALARDGVEVLLTAACELLDAAMEPGRRELSDGLRASSDQDAFEALVSEVQAKAALGHALKARSAIRALWGAPGLWQCRDQAGRPRKGVTLRDALTYGEALIIDMSAARNRVIAAAVVKTLCAEVAEHCKLHRPVGLYFDELTAMVPSDVAARKDPVAELVDASARHHPAVAGVMAAFAVDSTLEIPTSTRMAIGRCPTRAYFRISADSHGSLAASEGTAGVFSTQDIASLPPGVCAMRVEHQDFPLRPFRLRLT